MVAGWEAVALLTIEPVVLGSMVPVMATTTVPPTGMEASALTLPEPDAGVQVAPPAVVQVQVGVRMLAGMVSAMVTALASEGPALVGLVGGDTAFAVTNVAAAIGHIGSGRLRALGVTSKTEFAQLPGVPPIARTLSGFENTGWFGIVAPTGTSRDIIQKVYLDTKKALESTEMRARLYVQGLAPVGNTPEEMGAAMKAETGLWARVVRERKIKVE